MRLNPSALSRRAGHTLSQVSYSPGKLMLIHEGVVLAVTLLLTALTFYINEQTANMGGLSAMGQQAVWSTVQAVLELAVLIFLPLWQIGLVYVGLKWVRGENAAPGDLLQGLRRWGPAIRLRLLEAVLFFALAMAISNIATILFFLTPFSDDLLEVMKPLVEQMEDPMQTELTITPELTARIMEKSLPLLILCGVLCAVVFVFVFYRIRFADYGVMSGKGAIRSLVDSVHCTRKNALQVAKVDLFFWWFYLLQILSGVLRVGDTLLAYMGISLPVSAEVGYFLFYILGGLAQLALMWRFRAQVATAYAAAYEVLEQTPAPEKKPAEYVW